MANDAGQPRTRQQKVRYRTHLEEKIKQCNCFIFAKLKLPVARSTSLTVPPYTALRPVSGL